MRAPIFLVLLFLVNSALAGISSSTGLQRKIVGDNCTFQWTTTGTVNDFVVYNQTTGTSVAQNSRVSLKGDSIGHTINMTITSIALWDAGNYTLSTTNGVVWENDSSALLFVFITGSVSLSQTTGRNPALEGDLVELTCTFTSKSIPTAYRPRALYSWYATRFIYTLQVLSNGSLQIPNGGIVSGYSTRNNGTTLTISAVQYNDNYQNINCYVNEEGSPSATAVKSFYLYVQYKPIASSTNPPTRKFNAMVGERVTLSVSQIAYPVVLETGNNWTFVSNGGYDIIDVPDGSVVGTYTGPYLSFTLPSIEYYGKYSYNMSNLIGTTMVTFEVLPPGKPDPPAAFQVAYATHFSIGLQWNCMWSNFNNRTQYVYTLLRDPKNNVTLGNQSLGVSGTCYNSAYVTNPFNLNIQPDTKYEATVWSTNEIGSSGITTISIRSAKVFRFIVSSDSIQLNGTTAIVNYRIESGSITRFQIAYCYELTGACYTSTSFYVNNNIGQVNFSIGSLPNGTEYVFDFYLYVGSAYSQLCGLVKGIRVYRAMGPATPPGNTDVSKGDYVSAVIALAVVLGIAVLAIIGMLIGFLIWKRRNYSPKSNLQELQRTNPAESEDYYESMNRQDSENRVYANIDQTKRI